MVIIHLFSRYDFKPKLKGQTILYFSAEWLTDHTQIVTLFYYHQQKNKKNKKKKK